MLRGVEIRRGVALACLLAASAARADLDLAPAGSLSLANGALDLGCSDITIGSSAALNLNAAPVTGVRNVTIQPGGILDFGTGSITFAGAFVNNGGQIANLGLNSIRPATNLACAQSGPTLIGIALPVIPTLTGWGLALLALLLGSSGIALARRRRDSHDTREQSHAIRK